MVAGSLGVAPKPPVSFRLIMTNGTADLIISCILRSRPRDAFPGFIVKLKGLPAVENKAPFYHFSPILTIIQRVLR